MSEVRRERRLPPVVQVDPMRGTAQPLFLFPIHQEPVWTDDLIVKRISWGWAVFRHGQRVWTGATEQAGYEYIDYLQNEMFKFPEDELNTKWIE